MKYWISALLVLLNILCCNVFGRSAPDLDFRHWGQEAMENIERDHRIDGRPGYYEDQAKKAVAFTWGNSMLLLAYAKAAQFDKAYYETLHCLMRHIETYWVVDKGIGGYDVLPASSSVVDRYYDDNAWVAMGQIDAYHATKKQKYLQSAAKTILFCLSGIDKQAGGIWWRERWPDESRKSKNTCSIAPTAFSCLRYYELTQQQYYLDTAKELLLWLDQYLKDKDGLYFDSLRVSGQIDRRKWSYNSAMPLRCYVLLYKLTGGQAYLDKALEIAESSKDRWYDRSTGAIRCEAMFAFTLAEGWVELSDVTCELRWRKLAESSLRYVHAHVRDPNGRYSDHWNDKNTEPLTHWKLLYPASTARAYWALVKPENKVDCP